jgi:uncharacterized protein YheU (UPF0270 family)
MRKDGDSHWNMIDKLLELDFINVVECNKPNPQPQEIDTKLKLQISECTNALRAGEEFHKIMVEHDIPMRAPQNMEELNEAVAMIYPDQNLS